MIWNLDESESRLLRQCLTAVVDGPFLPDRICSVLMGVEKWEVREVINMWPNVRDHSFARYVANNAMVNLINYPHGRDIGDYVDGTVENIDVLIRKLKP